MDTEPVLTGDNFLGKDVPTILAIDDDPLVRQSIVMYLEDCGYDVLEAENGQEGIEVYREHSPDLILCDIRMPELSGMQVLEVVTKESPDVPVIMISGAGMINDVVESLRLGALDYLVKPISDLGVLGHAVKQALTKKQLEFENQLFRTELEKANQELQNNLNVLQKDQEAGRRAQLQLLPPPESTIGDYEFLHTVIPSLNVSGDFLDYFEIDNRHIGFYIADVSGHGSASAFVTMMLKSLFNQPIRNYRISKDRTILSPKRVLEYLNQEILSANVSKHVTVFYAVIDTQLKKLDYGIAGHFPRPMLITDGNKYIIEHRGFPVGMFDWASFEEHQVSIDKEFSICLFSDGVLECMNEEGIAEEQQLLALDINHDSKIEDVVQQLNVRNTDKIPDDVSLFIVRNHASKS